MKKNAPRLTRVTLRGCPMPQAIRPQPVLAQDFRGICNRPLMPPASRQRVVPLSLCAEEDSLFALGVVAVIVVLMGRKNSR